MRRVDETAAKRGLRNYQQAEIDKQVEISKLEQRVSALESIVGCKPVPLPPDQVAAYVNRFGYQNVANVLYKIAGELPQYRGSQSMETEYLKGIAESLRICAGKLGADERKLIDAA